MNDWVWSNGGMLLTRKNGNIRIKPVPLLLCPLTTHMDYWTWVTVRQCDHIQLQLWNGQRFLLSAFMSTFLACDLYIRDEFSVNNRNSWQMTLCPFCIHPGVWKPSTHFLTCIHRLIPLKVTWKWEMHTQVTCVRQDKKTLGRMGIDEILVKQGVNVRVKFTLEQAMKPQTGSRAIVLLFP